MIKMFLNRSKISMLFSPSVRREVGSLIISMVMIISKNYLGWL